MCLVHSQYFTGRRIIAGCDLNNFNLPGVDFQLMVHRPPADAQSSQFLNDEIPRLVGTYCRELDTQAQMCIEWKVALYRWYNQAQGYDMEVTEP